MAWFTFTDASEEIFVIHLRDRGLVAHARDPLAGMEVSGRGFALAPLLAELLAGWLATGERPDLVAPFDPDRFADASASTRANGVDYYAGYRGAEPATGS